MEDQFYENRYYHIFFHAIGKERIFITDRNYIYFLEKYKYYLSDYVETHAYSLLPNHVHLLIKTKPFFLEKSDSYNNVITNRFGKLKHSYTKGFNMINKRFGSLFTRTLKRKSVSDENYYGNLIKYINTNAVHHRICKDPEQWKYCSYSAMVSDSPTTLMRGEVLKIFNGDRNIFRTNLDFGGFELDEEFEV